MITLKSAREIEAMDKAGDFLASIHIGLRDLIKPGVDMWEVEEYVRKNQVSIERVVYGEGLATNQ